MMCACSTNNGHVARSVVKRVLARLGVLPTGAQVRALEARYLDDCGFNYVKLLQEVFIVHLNLLNLLPNNHLTSTYIVSYRHQFIGLNPHRAQSGARTKTH